MFLDNRLSETLLPRAREHNGRGRREASPRTMFKSRMGQLVYSPRRGVRQALALFPLVFGAALTLMVAASLTQLGHGVLTGAISNSKAFSVSSVSSSAVRELAESPKPAKEKKTCEEPYGGLPCSTSLTGSIFLMVAYGFILLIAARMISDGSELLLEVLNPGLIGGLLLPTLGAFPDALLIAVSGIGGSQEEAKKQVLVGVGVLAGSTIMILTLLWGGSLILGRCDLEDEPLVATDGKLTKGWSLTQTGVTCDKQTSWGAYVMMASVLPYIVVQIPLVNGKNKTEGHTASLIGSIVAGVSLVLVFIYQVWVPNLQKKKMAEARLHYIRCHALNDLTDLSSKKSFGGLLEEDGKTPNKVTMKSLFDEFDKDKNGQLSKAEVRALIVGLGTERVKHVPNEDEVEEWLKEFDSDSDNTLSLEEFTKGLGNWMAMVSKVQKAKNVATWKETLQRQFLAAETAPAPTADERGTRWWLYKHQVLSGEVCALSEGRERGQTYEPLLQNGEGTSQEAAGPWHLPATQSESLLEILQKEVEEEVEEADEEKEKEEKQKSPAQIYREALFWILGGVALVAVFADPMVDSVTSFSEHSGIPSFFVAFIVTPLASNASEVVSSLIFAAKKRKRTLSLTFSQVYGAITMNNTLCMLVFLMVVYMRGLLWEFSAEVTVILLVTFLVGIMGATRTTFPLWTAIPVIALYPLSIAFVAVLDYVVGWK